MSLNIGGSTRDDGHDGRKGQNVGSGGNERDSENRGHRDSGLRGLVSKLGKRGSTNGTRSPTSPPASASWWAPKNSPYTAPTPTGSGPNSYPSYPSSHSPSYPPARLQVTSPPRAMPTPRRPELATWTRSQSATPANLLRIVGIAPQPGSLLVVGIVSIRTWACCLGRGLRLKLL